MATQTATYITKPYTTFYFHFLFRNHIRHSADLVIDTTVNINAIPILSKILGCKSNKGKTNSCINTANIKPLPTSIILSVISLFIWPILSFIVVNVKPLRNVELYIVVLELQRKAPGTSTNSYK